MNTAGNDHVAKPDSSTRDGTSGTTRRQEVAIIWSKVLADLASQKDSSALEDEADGGFGDANIESRILKVGS